MKPDKVVLLTGGTGFIGSHLAANLQQSGFAVHVILRPDSNVSRLTGLTGKQSLDTQVRTHLPAPVIAHVHNGTTRGLIDIVKDVNPHTVFHLASLFIAEHVSDDVDRLIASNVLFGTQLLEAMRINHVHRLVNTGTSWQHFHTGSNDNAERPSCLYAATKQAFQDLVNFYCDAYSLRAVTLKLFDTYGPGDPRRKLFKVLKDAAQTRELLPMSAGEQLIDLVYIDDVIEAFKVAESRLSPVSASASAPAPASPHEIFGISSGNPRPLREVVERYKALCAPDLEINWGARPYRAREVMVNWSGLPVLPGWTPRVNLEDGLRKLNQAERSGAARSEETSPHPTGAKRQPA